MIRSVTSLGAFGDVESNALLLVGLRESVLLDTPASVAQTSAVLDRAESELKRPVRHLIVTHGQAGCFAKAAASASLGNIQEISVP